MRKMLMAALLALAAPAFAQQVYTPEGEALSMCRVWDGADIALVSGAGRLLIDGSGVTQPVSGTVTANQGGAWTNACTQSGTWTVQPGNTANSTAWLVTGTGGTFPVTDSGGSLTVDNGGTFATQAAQSGAWNITNVSGTVSLPTGAATSANQSTEITALQLIDNLPSTLGSSTSGQSGALALGAVTTAAPTYTTAQSNALSLNTAGGLRVDGSAVTQPVSGTVTANAGTGTFTVAGAKTNDSAAPGSTNVGALVAVATTAAPTYTTGNLVALSTDLTGALRVAGSAGGTSSSFGAAFPSTGTAAGFFDGTNMSSARTFDLDSGAGTQNGLGVNLRKIASGGSVEAGTSADPLRTDPTGTTSQPVTDAGGSLTVDNGGTFATQATQAGTWTVQPGNTANSTAWLMTGTGGTFPVTDSGGSLTVDNAGTFAVQAAATQSGTWTVQPGNAANTTAWLVTGTGGTFPVTDSGGSITVDNGGTFAVQAAGAKTNNNAAPGATNVGTLPAVATTAAPSYTTGNQVSLSTDLVGSLRVVCTSGCTPGGSFADNSAFTFGTTAVSNTGYVVDDTATNTVTENSAGAPRMNTNRIAYSNLRNNAGIEAGTLTGPLYVRPTDGSSAATPFDLDLDSGTFVTTNRQSIGIGLSVNGGPVPLEGGAGNGSGLEYGAYARLLQTNSVNLGSTGWTSATSVDSAVSVSTLGFATVVVTMNRSSTVSAGVASFEASDDSGTTWYPVYGAVANAASQTVAVSQSLAALASTQIQVGVEGFTNFRVRLNPVITGAGTINVRVTPTTSPAGRQTLSTIAIQNAAFQNNLTQVGSSTANTGIGAAGTGTLRVAVSTDSVLAIGSMIPGTGATNLGKAEDAAAASGDGGVFALAVRRDTPTSGAAAGDYHEIEVSNLGEIWVREGQRRTYSAATTAKTATTAGTGTWFSLCGSATTTIRVQQFQARATVATAGVYADLTLKKSSTATSAGTATTLTQVPHDSSSAAGTATNVKFYTVLGTAGTPVGSIWSDMFFSPITGTPGSTLQVGRADWQAKNESEAIVLRGTAQCLEANFGTTTTNAPTITVMVTWTEE